MIHPQDILGKPKRPLRPDLDQSYEQFETGLPRWEGGLKSAIQTLKEKRPDLYKQFFPKIYSGVDKYSDWRIPHVISAFQVIAARVEPEVVEDWQAHTNLLSFSLEWQQCQTPHFFVTPALLDAMNQTGIPADFNFEDFKLPFPALVFTFPKTGSGIPQFKGRPVKYIGLSRRKGTISTPLGEIRSPETLDKLIVTTAFYPDTFFGVGYKANHLNDVVRMNLKQFWEAAHQVGEAAFDENESAFTLSLLKLALALVLAMEAKPDLIECGKRLGVMTRRGATQELWSPNVLGSRYRIRHEDNGEPAGTHASPRTHWRRGHYRMQGKGQRIQSCADCGDVARLHHPDDKYCQRPDCLCRALKLQTKFTEYEVVWIEPILISAPVVAAKVTA